MIYCLGAAVEAEMAGQPGFFDLSDRYSVGLPAYDDDRPYAHLVESGSPHARYAVLRREPLAGQRSFCPWIMIESKPLVTPRPMAGSTGPERCAQVAFSSPQSRFPASTGFEKLRTFPTLDPSRDGRIAKFAPPPPVGPARRSRGSAIRGHCHADTRPLWRPNGF